MLGKRLAACRLEDSGDAYWTLDCYALGSQCSLFFKAENQKAAEAFRETAFDWLARFEARFSRFLPDSLISEINRNAGLEWTSVDRETEVLFGLCDHSHFVTKGAFDATSLPLSLLWNWKEQHDEIPTEAAIASARSLVGWNRFLREPGRVLLPEPGMMLDLGGVGKEFAVDCLLQLGISQGIENLMVDLGGDIAVVGEPPEGGGWYVGLEDPTDTTKSYCGIRLRTGLAVATSGDYRRCFQVEGVTYGHILDSRTGRPVANQTRACSVIASRCGMAGLLATSAMILGGREAVDMLNSMPGVEGCVYTGRQLLESRGFRRVVLPAGWDAE
jgi:thiamine biosynthesis lipoprotein